MLTLWCMTVDLGCVLLFGILLRFTVCLDRCVSILDCLMLCLFVAFGLVLAGCFPFNLLVVYIVVDVCFLEYDLRF